MKDLDGSEYGITIQDKEEIAAPKRVREYNVGSSDYAEHKIQPWDIWLEYVMNPWDADIIKRMLRTKPDPVLSEDEARIMDYEKIKHICDERIRQLRL